jgi:hypothetical protein
MPAMTSARTDVDDAATKAGRRPALNAIIRAATAAQVDHEKPATGSERVGQRRDDRRCGCLLRRVVESLQPPRI